MATVYLARDLRHGTRVAIKVLRPELAAVMGGSRFSREIEITAGLQHPNILPLLDSGEAAGFPYYVMPYVEDETLAARLERETLLPVDEAVRLVAEAADALHHAHTRGIVHRDVKPGNILLSHGHAVVADFGIARALQVTGADRLTGTGVAIGTASYMSPEQASAESVDGRSDIYSLGCVLYEALAGTPPFTGPSAQAIMARNAVDPVPSIRTVRTGVSPALEAVIHRALAKLPQDRFATAAEFREALLKAATMPATASRPRAALRAAVGTLAVLGLAASAWVVRSLTARPGLDPNRVVVFPLLLPAGWAGPRSAGEDAATVIGSAMDGAGSLRWVDGWQQLDAARRDSIRLLTARDAIAIARRERAAWVITGRMVQRGDSADVFLELHDVAGDSIVVRPPGKAAPLGEGWRGGMRAITEILPRLIPTAVPDVESEWKARPPQAVAHFLLGESAFRRVQLAVALAEFRKAVEADSGFGLAAIRGAQAAMWNHQPDQAEALVRLAAAQPLNPRFRLLAEGLRAYLGGSADSAVARFREVIALDPAMGVAWLQLGEVYLHRLPSGGRTDSLAEEAFLRARALDTTAATTQFHLVELLARRGDRAGAAAYATRFLRTAADTQLANEVRLVAACDGSGFRGLHLADEAARRSLAVLLAAKATAIAVPTARCAFDGYGALLQEDTASTPDADGRRFFALLGRFSLLLWRGRADSATALVEEFYARYNYGRSLYLLGAPVVESLRGRAREVAREDSARAGADYTGITWPVRLWALGVWAATDGRPATARAVARRLADRARTGGPVDSLLAESLAAHTALAEGDSTGAVRHFSTVITRFVPAEELTWNEAASLGYDRLVLGRLLVARQEYARAITVLDVLDSALPATFPLYQAESLRLRAGAASRLGNPALARALEARVAALSGG